MNNPPPPIINCTQQDLGFSDKVVMLYKTISPPSISINTRIFYLDGIIAEPDEPVRKEIDIKDCLDIFQPENLFPESNVKVLSVSLYRLSAAESFSLDSP